MPLLKRALTLAGIPFPSSRKMAAKAMPTIGEKIIRESIGSTEMSI
jgi:hypothetical protein